ncbi:MAG: ABC transporter ATP-binding protein [Ruminococcaceae bacterium]|nr:ABC transporter ATP-binding protein [Oscillospiraceae bacterium]
MKKVLKYLKNYRVHAIIGPLFKLFEAVLELSVPLVVASIADIGIANGDRSYIVKMCLLLIIMGAAGLACALTAQYFAAKAACGASAELRSALFEKIQTLSFPQLDRIGTPTLITRMTSDINQVQTGINLTLRLLLRSPFVVFGAMIMTFAVGAAAPATAAVFAVTIPVLLVVVFIILTAGVPLYRKSRTKLDAVTGKVSSNLAGARVLRAFCMEDNENAEFAERSESLTKMQIVAGRISGLLNPLTYVIINIAIIALLYYSADGVDTGLLTQGQMIALYNYMTQILVELIKMANLIITVTKSIACAGRISAVMDENADMLKVAGTNTVDANAPVLSLRDVDFRYAGASGDALKNINITLKKGQKLGVIGGTGSGKTTLAALIPRFYDATGGEVLVNGRNVREYGETELRSRIGYVAQNVELFRGTVRDNIKWGKPDATDEEIMAALNAAQLKEIKSGEENTLDIEVGQNGRNLSGGQRQRLTIARALVRRPEILILDNSSSALDQLTEANLLRAISELDFAPSVLVISQRAVSVRGCDQILVLDGGEPVGVGSHEELYAACEIYREICDSQMGGASI